jgi:hypothetical protein
MFQGWTNIPAILSMWCPSFLLLGVSFAMILVPRGAIGALLKSYFPKMCVAAESLGLIIDVISILNVMTACGSNLSHKCIGKDLSVEQSPAIK